MRYKHFRYLKFRKRTKEAKIIYAGSEVLFFVIMKISFKFKAFGVLMIYFFTDDGAFICACLVGEDNIFQTVNKCGNFSRKCDDSRKRSMTVKVSFIV